MADGSTPGDGKTNPFGNGQGGAGESRAMAGNNFIENARGANTGTVKPPNFLTQTAPQKARNETNVAEGGINPDDAAPGPRTAAEAADASGDMSGGNVGVGSVGNGAKPFTLGGGGA